MLAVCGNVMHDIVIMRTIIDLPEEQVSGLELLCRREGISRAEAVRRALKSMLAARKVGTRAEAFGAWSGKKLDSRKHVAAIRSEWEK